MVPVGMLFPFFRFSLIVPPFVDIAVFVPYMHLGIGVTVLIEVILLYGFLFGHIVGHVFRSVSAPFIGRGLSLGSFAPAVFLLCHRAAFLS